MSEFDSAPRAATIAVLVENEPGILARVVGLFSGRGYNIDSLTVAPVDETGRISRITIVTSGTEMVIEQIKAHEPDQGQDCRHHRLRFARPRARAEPA
jgi:acetolactate synthase-1/3 small subunit